MNLFLMTRPTWKRFFFAILLILLAAILRVWPLQSLGTKVVWLTFYPAVMAVALYGGIPGGLLGTALTCLIVAFFWRFLSPSPYMNGSADWLSMGVFIFTCTMISLISEGMRQSNIRAKEAREKAQEAQEKALAAQEKAQAANEAKGVFLANMSHELRTPLNAIIGYSQLMQQDRSVSGENLRYLQIIGKSGDHLLALINDILEISKIESKKAVLSLMRFDLHEMVEEIGKMLEVRLEVKKLSFKVVGLEQVPRYVVADALKLKTVLINLIGNAVKFTSLGGVSVEFSAEGVKPGEDGFLLHVAVVDTGSGISDAETEMLFRFFSQTESGIASRSGSGLGLAISQEYVRLMGGKISVSSEIGIGSKFAFSITLQKVEMGEQDEIADNRVIMGIQDRECPPRILVAEDHPDNRALLVKLLQDVHFNVVSAENGKEAVEQFKTNHPDFIWMDIRMPVMDGLEATKLIKSMEGGKDTIIVALSAHVFGEERSMILEAGCDDFLGKPYLVKDVFSMMSKHLHLSYLYAEANPPVMGSGPGGNRFLADLEKIGRESREAIRQAILLLDDDRIHEAISVIRMDAPETAKRLEEELVKLNYTKMLQLVGGDGNPDESRCFAPCGTC